MLYNDIVPGRTRNLRRILLGKFYDESFRRVFGGKNVTAFFYIFSQFIGEVIAVTYRRHSFGFFVNVLCILNSVFLKCMWSFAWKFGEIVTVIIPSAVRCSLVRRCTLSGILCIFNSRGSYSIAKPVNSSLIRGTLKSRWLQFAENWYIKAV